MLSSTWLLFSIVLFLAFILTNFTVKIVINIGKNFGIEDIPDARKRHNFPVVNIGGLSIYFSLILSILFFILISDLELIDISNTKILIILICASLYFFIGLIDDIYKLSPWPRLILQLILGSFIWFSGIRIQYLDLNFFYINDISNIYLDNSISFLLTIVWLSGVINAINWIDGLDGLATGIGLICSISFLIISFLTGQLFASLISTALIGSLFSFLKFNYYPAKIIMGDGGSNLIGFLLGILSLIGLTESDTLFSPLLSILILFVPLFDMVYVIVYRIIRKKSPFYGDRSHIHHRLQKKGINYTKVVRFILMINCLFSFSAVILKIYFI